MSASSAAAEGDNSILLQRVRKLLDKAGATSNPHEAEAFSTKAAQLITRHRIDPDQLRADAAGQDLAVRTIPLGRGAYVRARLSLLAGVAAANDVRIVFDNTPTGTIAHLAGYVEDLDGVEVLYHSLHAQAATRMARERRATAAATQRHRRSFLFGYAERMSQLLATSRRDIEAEVGTDADGATGVAVALVERRERVDEFAKESFGRVRTARAPGRPQEAGWRAGVAAADSADLGRSRLTGRPALGRG
jgi:hypothetical protein